VVDDRRRPLLDLIQVYSVLYPDESETVRKFRALLRSDEEFLSRRCFPGHITASTWILSPDRERCLLTHHRKLGKWLQLGGHVDGEIEVHKAAVREAEEESGLRQFDLRRRDGFLVPLDLDIHPIPRRGEEPHHLHYDVRFLLGAADDEEPVCSGESHEVRWVPRRDLTTLTKEESVLRLDRKAAEW